MSNYENMIEMSHVFNGLKEIQYLVVYKIQNLSQLFINHFEKLIQIQVFHSICIDCIFKAEFIIN
jgi:hypothetical protein